MMTIQQTAGPTTSVVTTTAASGVEAGEGAAGARPAAAPALPLLERPTGGFEAHDLVARVALLVERGLSDRRAAADRQREVALQAQAQAERAEVAMMREEARDTFGQALVGCAISLAASSASMASACLSVRGAALDRVASGLGKMHDASARVCSATAEIVSSLGKGAEGLLAAEIKGDAAAAKEHAHAAASAGRRAQREADTSREAADLAARTLQRLEAALEQQHQTRLALAQRC